MLIYDDFRADNEGTVRQVLRFLDVDDTLPVPPVELDTLRTPRYVWLDQAMRVSAMARRTDPAGEARRGPRPRSCRRRCTTAARAQSSPADSLHRARRPQIGS